MSSFYKKLSRKTAKVKVFETVRRKSLQWFHEATDRISSKLSKVVSMYQRNSQRRGTLKKSKRFSYKDECLDECDHKFILKDNFERVPSVPKEPPRPQYHRKLPCRWEWENGLESIRHIYTDPKALSLIENQINRGTKTTVCEAEVHEPVKNLYKGSLNVKQNANRTSDLEDELKYGRNQRASFYV